MGFVWDDSAAAFTKTLANAVELRVSYEKAARPVAELSRDDDVLIARLVAEVKQKT